MSTSSSSSSAYDDCDVPMMDSEVDEAPPLLPFKRSIHKDPLPVVSLSLQAEDESPAPKRRKKSRIAAYAVEAEAGDAADADDGDGNNSEWSGSQQLLASLATSSGSRGIRAYVRKADRPESAVEKARREDARKHSKRKKLIPSEDEVERAAIQSLKQKWAQAARDCEERAKATYEANNGAMSQDPFRQGVDEATPMDIDYDAFFSDTEEGLRMREDAEQESERLLLLELEKLEEISTKKYDAGEESMRLNLRTTLASDRLRDAGNCEGDRRMEAIFHTLNNLGYTRSNFQTIFHDRFVQAILPLSVFLPQTRNGL